MTGQMRSQSENESAPEPAGGVDTVAIAWLPAGDYEQATTLWPVRAGDPALIAWRPDRNQPCWCGSGRKYKKCCAAPTSVDADPHR